MKGAKSGSVGKPRLHLMLRQSSEWGGEMARMFKVIYEDVCLLSV